MMSGLCHRHAECCCIYVHTYVVIVLVLTCCAIVASVSIDTYLNLMHYFRTCPMRPQYCLGHLAGTSRRTHVSPGTYKENSRYIHGNLAQGGDCS